jgi:hypothetical protein
LGDWVDGVHLYASSRLAIFSTVIFPALKFKI